MDWAWMLYAKGDWEGVAFLTGRALAISHRERTYITESAAWGSLPWDLRAIALYRLGRLGEALEAAERACDMAPGDERLKNNAALIRREAAAKGE